MKKYMKWKIICGAMMVVLLFFLFNKYFLSSVAMIGGKTPIGQTFLFSKKVISNVETKQKVVALTFDADMTPKMLNDLKKNKVSSLYNKSVIDVLIKNKVPATLFLTGMWIETYPDVTRQLSGNSLFEVANHSYSHPAFKSPCYNLEKIKADQETYQISKTDTLLKNNTVRYVKLFRFPGLCYDASSLRNVLDQGYEVIGGDVLSGDGFQNNVNIIVSNVVGHVKPGSIVILHMNGGMDSPKTGDALPIIISKLKKEGYTFVKVSDLLKGVYNIIQ
jgi:peptidoglycan-N-acetylglucosamine deacetylase